MQYGEVRTGMGDGIGAVECPVDVQRRREAGRAFGPSGPHTRLSQCHMRR